MKKTWKQLLGTLSSSTPRGGAMALKAICGRLTQGAAIGTLAIGTLMGQAFAQGEDDGVVVLGQGSQQMVPAPPSEYDEGAVQLGAQPAGFEPAPYDGYQSMPYESGMPVDGYTDPSGYPVDTGYGSEASTIQPGGTPGSSYAPYGSVSSSGGGIGYAVTQDPEDVLLRVGRRNGDIYGINQGYTSLGAFLSHVEDANSLWFVLPRLVITDQGRGGLNLGFGQKAYIPDLDRVFSLSGWWDFDTGHQTDYHQVGLSFEMLGRNMSIRSNANFVVSKNETTFGASNIGAPLVTDDGGLVQMQRVFKEVAYNQADVEIAAPMPLLGQYGWEWGGGAYWLFGSDGRDATGVKGRVESQVTEDLWVNAIITSDRVFDTNVSVNLEFTVPHAPPSKWWRRPSVRDQMWSTPDRYYRVATAVVQSDQVVPVMVMGGNGQMQQMRLGLVNPNLTNDPTQAFGGSGTAADPWKSIADYMDEALATQEQFGIIAVQSRTDDTDLNLNTTIVLLNGQALFGSGVTHSLDGVNPIDIPTISTTGNRPMLTNSDAPGLDVVTLANANQVSGFVIDAGGTASGIVGDGVRGFNVNQVEMNNVIDGIRIRSLGAPGGTIGRIENNVINGIGLGSPRGISITHESGTLGLIVSNNTVNNFRGEDANQNGVLDPSEDTNLNGLLDPGEDINFDGMLNLSEDLNLNGALDSGFGIYIAATGGSTIFANDPTSDTLPLGILSNTLGTNGTGLSIQAIGGSLVMADVQDNTATGSTDLGEDANLNGMLDPGEDVNSNGKLDFGSGFQVFADGSTISLNTFTGNSATDGAGNGGSFQTLNGGAINLVNPNIDPTSGLPALAFTNNTFNTNALDGLFVRADSGSIIFDQIQSSNFNSNGDDGLDMETDNGGTIFVRDPLVANFFTANGDNGLEVTSGVGGGVTLTIGNPTAGGGMANTIFGNGTDTLAENRAGIFLGTVGGTLNATFSGLSSSANAGSGALIFLDGGTINIAGGITNNVFTNNGEHGLAIVNNNGGRLITPFVSDNDFSNNNMAGLFLGGTGPAPSAGPPTTTALTDLGSITRNNFNRDVRGTEGILIDASDVRIQGTLTKNTFIGRQPTVDMTTAPFLITEAGAGRGIGGTITGSSSVTTPGGLSLVIGTGLASDNNTFTDNGDAHIGVVMAGNTTNSIVVQNGTFNNSFDRRPVGTRRGAPPTGQFQGEGIHYALEDTATLTGGVLNSTLSGNEGDGLLIEIAGNNDAGNSSIFPAAQLNNFVIRGNTISNNGIRTDIDGDGLIDGVLADGISVQRRERGQYNDLLIVDNEITGNTQNGIQLLSFGVDQLNLPNMRPDTAMVLNNEISGNLQDGIEFVIGADADVAARLDNNLITGNGFGEAIPGSVDQGNGIQVREQIQAGNDARSLTGLWTNNEITGNFDDGIDLSGRVGNTLSELSEAGVYTLAPPAPGTMLPNIGLIRSYGLVIGNETLNSIGILNPNGNLISGNGSDGIDITAPGVVTIGNNVIRENGTFNGNFVQPRNPYALPNRFVHAGINIDGAEFGPGQSGDFTGQFPTPDNDIDPNILAFREVLVLSNLITQNNGDGIELMSEPSYKFFNSPIAVGAIETALTIVNNEITLNAARGIDILQRTGDNDNYDRDNEDPDGRSFLAPVLFDLGGGFSTDVTIIGNHIKGNQEEGIYVVQTVANNQNQVDTSAVATNVPNSNGESLSAQGNNLSDTGDTPRLRLDIHNNEIIGNGTGIVDFPASGLVIRAGTNGGNRGFRGSNYFATSGFTPEDVDGDGILDNDLDGDGFLDAAPVTISGISTSITQNLFNGNFGDDVLFQSYTDTVAPVTAAGSWSDTEFTVTLYESDPLSRLDIIFSENRLNSIEANNREDSIGTSPGNAGTPLAGAYYNDADGVFKSRLNTATPPGPFGNASRIRNATRFSSRYLSGAILPPNPIISPDGGIFAYPGMGNSTFRVKGTGNFYLSGTMETPFTLDQAFIFDQPELAGDPTLVDFQFEANGVFPSLPPGGLPWGWDDLEVQTVFDQDFLSP